MEAAPALLGEWEKRQWSFVARVLVGSFIMHGPRCTDLQGAL